MRITLLFIGAFLTTLPSLQAQNGKEPAQVQSGKEPIQVTDMLKIATVGDIHLSPDGRLAVFTLTTIEPDTAGKSGKWDYKYTTQLYLSGSDGSSAPRQLTTAREGASQPAWTPDGQKIAFVRSVDGKLQVFVLSLEGGEPMQLTRFRYGASSPRWSPDGKEILFSARIGLRELIRDSILNPGYRLPAWPDEKPGIAGDVSLRPAVAKPNPDGNLDEIHAYLDMDVTDKKAKVVTKLNFQDEMEVNPDMSFTHWFVQAVPAGTGSVVAGAGSGAASPVAVTRGFYNFNSADFTPDGKSLVLVAHIDSTTDPDRALESEIYLADRDGSHLRELLGGKDKVFGNPRVSPDGAIMAYTESATSFVTLPELKMMKLGDPREIRQITFDRAPQSLTWSNDSRYLYFTASSNGGQPLYRVRAADGKVEQLSSYDDGTLSFDIRGDRLLFSRTQPADPSELYAADAGMQAAQLISAFNTGWLAQRQLSLPEKHSFRNAMGETIEYWVMKPIGYIAGKRYPLLLDIHGGPSAMWGPGEASMWHEFQFFCGRGYGVVYCNPRGSGGYGLDFLRANIKDWGTGPTSDVLTALDNAVAEGWADTARLVVSGGSYAGYLTAWIVGHDHRFKAACAQRGVYDLATFFGEGNAWRLVSNYFGGYPWEPEARALLEHESPITYVKDITTPLIIFHGENDRRTGFVEGEMLYRSLKVLGRPVEYVRHPGATHELTRSGDNRQRIDQMLRTYEFFTRYIGQ
jgi:dipeptidyl aminopeptidase/acylaminoacyl peptidase